MRQSVLALALLIPACKTTRGSATLKDAAPPSVAFPASLNCRQVSPAGTHTYSLTSLTKAPQMNGDAGVVTDNGDGTVTLDFGVGARGGDQYAYFTFRKADVAAMVNGSATTMPGQYASGYEWGDGTHITTEGVGCVRESA